MEPNRRTFDDASAIDVVVGWHKPLIEFESLVLMGRMYDTHVENDSLCVCRSPRCQDPADKEADWEA